MRFVAHIVRNTHTSARVSVNNKDGDTPDELSDRAIESLTRDLERTNYDTYLLDTEEKREEVSAYKSLVEEYGAFCHERITENKDYIRSIYVTKNPDKPITIFEGILDFHRSKYPVVAYMVVEQMSDSSLTEIGKFIDGLMNIQ